MISAAISFPTEEDKIFMLRGISTGKIILLVLTIILIGLISIAIYKLYPGVKNSLDPSQVIINFNQGELAVNFIGQDLTQENIRIKIGEQAFNFMNTVLINNHLIDENNKSVSLNLKFQPKIISFDNKKTVSLFDLPEEDLLENPSLEGNIKVSPVGENGYLVAIDNPEKIITEATLSGKLKLSEGLTTFKWWQLLSKLAKIKLKIDNGLVNGTVILK